MKELRITRDEDGRLEVWDGQKTSCQLTLGEMLDMVVKFALALPMPYAMMTMDEWSKRHDFKTANNESQLSKWRKLCRIQSLKNLLRWLFPIRASTQRK